MTPSIFATPILKKRKLIAPLVVTLLGRHGASASSAYQGRIKGLLDEGKVAIDKLPVSIGLIPQRSADRGTDSMYGRDKRLSVWWKTYGGIGKTHGDVYWILKVQHF